MEIRNQSEYVKERTTLRIEKGIHPNVSKRQQLFSLSFPSAITIDLHIPPWNKKMIIVPYYDAIRVCNNNDAHSQNSFFFLKHDMFNK